jgi:CheY-like chemotaxis protein
MHELLVIDDEGMIVDLLQGFFTHLGYKVATAKDGAEGIELFNTTPNFDLVITDLNMPGIDGNEVARCIRKSRRPEVPIVGMSGQNDKADGELFNSMVMKPFDLTALMKVVEQLV